MTIRRFKCGTCKCELELTPDAQPEPRAVCPRCGDGDTVDNVKRIVAQYLMEKSMEAANSTIVNAIHSPFLKITSDFRPKGGHRFIIDLEPH